MSAGLWAPERRTLTAGLVLTVTLVAFEALAVITILPLVERDLGHIELYGWVTSAFFLGTLIGIPIAGAQSDRRGPALPFLAGIALFGVGLLIGGLAPTMLVLVAARALQGLGAGAIPAVAYATIGRAYAEGLRPRVFAMMSTAWVVPGLIGPAISAVVGERFGWRAVFLGLLPLVAVAAALSAIALRRIGPPPQPRVIAKRTLPDAIRVALGTALVLAGIERRQALWAAAGILLGAAIAVRPLLRLLPAGTLRARPGLPATILMRGLLTFTFFGTDTYIPLAITAVHHRSVAVAGAAVTASTLTWTAGAWTQERRATRWSSRAFVTSGLVIVLVGIAMVTASLGLPAVALVVAGWGVAGLGMGLAYAPLSLLTLRHAPEGQQGAATASLQLADNLGVALGAGLGGVAVAIALGSGRTTAAGLAVAFISTGAVGLVALALCRRLPPGVMPPPPAS